MPRVDPYKDRYDHFPDSEPSTAVAVMFIGMIAAILIAAFVWASYAPQSAGKTGLNTPAISQPPPPTPTR
jgi:hypothetical protein